MSHYLNHYNNLRIQRPIACDHCSFSKAALPRTDLKANLLFERSARALFLRDPKDPLSLQIQLSAFHHNLQRFCHHRQLRRPTFSHLRNILSSSGQRDMVLYSIHTWLRYVINATAYLLYYLRWDVFHETSKGWISIQDSHPLLLVRVSALGGYCISLLLDFDGLTLSAQKRVI